MAKYALQNSSGVADIPATATTYVSLAAIFATTGATGPAIQVRRAKIYDILVGTNGTPADNFMDWVCARATAGSTRTYAGIQSSNNLQLDPADATMASFAAVNSSGENFTVTADTEPWYVGINQRASYRWVAAPGGEIVLPAVSSAGLLVRVKSGGYTGTSTVTVHFEEQ